MANTKAKKPTRNIRDESDKNVIHIEKPMYSNDKYMDTSFDEDWDYTPEGELELPKAVLQWMDENDLAYRWVRYRSGAEYETRNIAKNKKKGYEFLKRDALPQHLLEKFDTSAIDFMQDYVTVHDLTLMVTPKWKREIVESKLNSTAEQQLQIADDLLRKNVAEREGTELISETKSKVTGGGQREVVFSNRKSA